MRPQLVLLTLTTKHTGDVGADHDAIANGWRSLYKRMHDDYGAFPYVAVWEVTKGTDGLGHVHLHMAVVWQWRDWERIREQWDAAMSRLTGIDSTYLDIARGRRDGKPSTPGSVGNYLGKYLSKGVDVEGFTSYLRAEVSAGFYNQRSVLASLGFWKREPKCCRRCECRYRLVEIQNPTLAYRLPSLTIHIHAHGLEPPRIEVE